MFTPKKITDIDYQIVNNVEVICVMVPKAELAALFATTAPWACQSKGGLWGGGLREDAVLIGLTGELTTAKLFGMSVNNKPLVRGTGGKNDLVIKGMPIEIKTGAKGSNHQSLLVRYVTEGGYTLELKSNVYIAVRIISELDPDYVLMHIKGWCTRNDLLASPTVDSRIRRAKHKNKDIPYVELSPMRELLELISETS